MRTIDDIWNMVESKVTPKITTYAYRTEYEYIVDTICFRKTIYSTGEIRRIQKVYRQSGTFKHHEKSYLHDNAFIRVYMGLRRLIVSKELSFYEAGIFISISLYVGWETQMITLNDENFNVQELADELKIDRSNLMKCLKKFETLNLIELVRKKKETFIRMNQKYINKGRFFDKDIPE